MKRPPDYDEHFNGRWYKKTKLSNGSCSKCRFSDLQSKINTELNNEIKNLDDKHVLKQFYNSCIDVNYRDEHVLPTFLNYLRKIDNIKNFDDLSSIIGYLHKIGTKCMFTFSVHEDSKDKNSNKFHVDNLYKSLPECDEENIDDYMMVLTDIKNYLDIELDPQSFVNYQKNICKFTDKVSFESDYVRVSKYLDNVLPINWYKYFEALNCNTDTLIVEDHTFFQNFREWIFNTNNFFDQTKNYLKYCFILQFGKFTSFRLFDLITSVFEDHILYGTVKYKTYPERIIERFWRGYFKRADKNEIIASAFPLMDKYMENEIEKLYIKLHKVPLSYHVKIRKMCMNIINQFHKYVNSLDISETSRVNICKKLDTIKFQIGHTEETTDFEVELSHNLLKNIIKINKHKTKEEIDMLDDKPSKEKWSSCGHKTTDIFYLNKSNVISIPTCLLQKPFFDPKKSEEYNYGRIGALIGHEIMHAFDPTSIKYDHKGELNFLLTSHDKNNYLRITEELIDQYSDGTVNGKLTLNENVADIGGLIIAYQTLKSVKKNVNKGVFVKSFATMWREKNNEKYTKNFVLRDEHAPVKYRINNSLMYLEKSI